MGQFGDDSRPNDYGYFTAPREQSSGGQFGVQPATPSTFGTANSQFGGPPSTFGAPTAFGVAPPPPPYSPPKKSAHGAVRVTLIVVGVLLVLGAVNYAWHTYQGSRDVVVPLKLAGMKQTDDPELLQMKTEMDAELRSEHSEKLATALYGRGQEVGLLAIGRFGVDMEQEVRDLANGLGSIPFGPAESIGANTCVSAPQGGLDFCQRTSRNLTVEVVLIGQDASAAAAAVDTAWAMQ